MSKQKLQTDHTENHNLNPMHYVQAMYIYISVIYFILWLMGGALAERLAQDYSSLNTDV
jgi:hypothetical protein